MVNVNTLDHLLQIEAEAAALINDAQTEADRRVHENEEKNHLAYEERFKAEIQKQENFLISETEKIKKRYQETLSQYRQEISNIDVNKKQFCSLFNEYVENGL